MVTYVVPVVGLLLGIIFLNELLDVYIVVGATMIFMGIGVVNLRYFQRLNRVSLGKLKTT
jgi:drug/metabolite transporter (DMT)-like permease